MILIAVHERPAAVLRCLAASCGFQTDRNIAHHHNNFILQVATASFSSRYYIFKISTCILTYLHNFTLGKTFSSFLHNIFNPADQPKQPINNQSNAQDYVATSHAREKIVHSIIRRQKFSPRRIAGDFFVHVFWKLTIAMVNISALHQIVLGCNGALI